MTRIAYLMMDDLMSSNFSNYPTSDSILEHISSLVEICRFPIDLHDYPQLRDTHRADDLLSLCPDSQVEPFLSHLVRLLLYDIIMILGWSYLKRIDSHIIISVKYMSDLLYIPIKLFSSYQDKLEALVAIIGHISLF